jgi:hypothetical protein
MSNDSTFAIQTQALSKHYGRNGEIKALQRLSPHPNIIQLIEVL